MTLETDLEKMGQHLKDTFVDNQGSITITGGSDAYAKAVYGEPRVIESWPMLSVQPVDKVRSLREGATRKFQLNLRLYIVLYHGKVADTRTIQDETHQRAEAIEAFLHTDYKWNFVDSNDSSLDKVIFGFVTTLDHPVVVAPDQELWSASRLELNGLTQEVF